MREFSSPPHRDNNTGRNTGAMTISMNALLAVLLLVTALSVVLLETSVRRRIRAFRPLQLFTLGSAFLLVPANIALLGGDAPGNLERWVSLGSVAALVTQFVLLVSGWIPVGAAVPTRRILAVGAHPDDLELACGGTLARLADAGHEIHAIVAADGAVGGNAGERAGEAQRAGTFLGVTTLRTLGLPDTQLADHENTLTSAIEEKIRTLNPDIIFTHSAHDQHQDHTAVHRATMRAGRRHPAILCYESPSATANFSPQVFVDITEYTGVKSAGVAIHADQMDKPYMAGDVLTAKANFRGEQAKMEAAEAFEAVRIPAFRGVL